MNQQTLERFWTMSRDMLCLANPAGYLVDVNPRFTEVLGWSENELKERPFLEFVHPDDVEATLAETAKLAEGQPTLRFENRYKTKDGGWKWLAWTCEPVGDELFAVARDITALKEAHEIARAKMLAEARADALAAVARQQQTILNAAAHELNTPLTPLVMRLEILHDLVDDPKEQAAVAKLEVQVRRLRATIQGLLEVSRLATDKIVFDARRTAISTIIAGVGTHRVSGPDAEVEVDPDLVRQALTELIENAEQHGGGVEQITTRLEAGYALLEVSDRGPGFDGGVGEDWFLPLHRGGETQTRSGVGLGLTKVRLIALAHGGSAGVRSEGKGKGATAWLRIPTA